MQFHFFIQISTNVGPTLGICWPNYIFSPKQIHIKHDAINVYSELNYSYYEICQLD